MANGIRTGDTRGSNKGRSSKFREGSRVRQTPEEGGRTYRPKCFGNNNKDEVNSPKTLNDKNSGIVCSFFIQNYLLILNLRSFCIWIHDFFKVIYNIISSSTAPWVEHSSGELSVTTYVYMQSSSHAMSNLVADKFIGK